MIQLTLPLSCYFEILFRNKILGIISEEKLMQQIVTMNSGTNELSLKAVQRVPILPETTILGKVARILEIEPCVIIVNKSKELGIYND